MATNQTPPPNYTDAVEPIPFWKRLATKHSRVLIGVAVLVLAAIIMLLPVGGQKAAPKMVAQTTDTPPDAKQIQENAAQLDALVKSRKAAEQAQADGEKALSELDAQAGQLPGQSAGLNSGSLNQTGRGLVGQASTTAQVEKPQDHGFGEITVSGNEASPAAGSISSQQLQTLIAQEKQAVLDSFPQSPQRSAPAATAEPQRSYSAPQLADKKDVSGVDAAHDTTEHDIPDGPRYRLSEGKLIPGVLLNRLDGDNSGPAKVAVTEDVYDNTMRHILVPKGATLIGQVRAVGKQNERRLAVAFHRIEMPNDVYSIDLDKFPGLDQVGETALKDKVNNHMLSALLWSLPLGVASAASFANANLGYNANGLSEYRAGIAMSESQSAQQVLSRQMLNRLPTITIREGQRVTTWVAADLELPEFSH